MASSVAPEKSWSSVTNLKWSYDVFLSFRGEDTRSNFTSHLHMALCQKGVNVFIDEKLKRGERISESLFKSIEGSKISIIIFSENYASSAWCLDELVKIIECKESKGQLVLPVFYKVDPSEVRNQTGKFGKALAKHKTKSRFMSIKIQTWKEALTTAAGLSGWDIGTWKEADLIQDLVKQVLSILNRTKLPQVEAKHPVRIDSKLRAMEKLASHVVSDDGVCMVGIYGMGGIGNTTLAKALYNKLANQFEGCSFLSNVTESSEQFNGLVQLQQKLFSEILKDYSKVVNVERGNDIKRDRLRSKKVLIVLDDVDNLDQLEKLVGGRDWFGRGSKIIVTTRNKHLLSSRGFDQMHDIQGLDEDKALELFSWHATSYCKGLSLALVVLGSFLCIRNQFILGSILDEFGYFLTYDMIELVDRLQDILLDVLWFFLGEIIDYIRDMLVACYGISVLLGIFLLLLVYINR